MEKRVCRLLLGLLCAAAFTGCGQAEEAEPESIEPQRVELVVWGAEEDAELMGRVIQNFRYCSLPPLSHCEKC